MFWFLKLSASYAVMAQIVLCYNCVHVCSTGASGDHLHQVAAAFASIRLGHRCT